jgi:hypothetical protein
MTKLSNADERTERHAESRRLRVLEGRLGAARADWRAGGVHVVRGGERLLITRPRLAAASAGPGSRYVRRV